jgi:murein L,D-transpeptidase YcbB/YkuD
MNIKKVFVFIAATLMITSCKNNNKASAQNEPRTFDGRTVQRDYSINKSNSFNDIFLDSGAVEKFIQQEKITDTIATAIRGFYNARNFEYAWFASKGLIEQSFSFRSLYSSDNDADSLNKSLEARLDELRSSSNNTIVANDASAIKTELQITETFIHYALENYNGFGINPAALGNYIPSKRKSIIDLADSVLVDNSVNNNYANLNEAYKLLKVPLKQYVAIEKSGGWKTIVAGAGIKIYEEGASDAAVGLVKKRLQMTGELAGNDSTELFNPELETAIVTYQQNHGFSPTGTISTELIKDLNITALARVQQLLINMQRMRWMPTQPSGMLIIVNIPAFVVYVDSGNTVLFQMDVIVGSEGHNTTMFSGKVSQVVFSPYWNIPPSIVRKEMLGGMKRDRNYLSKRNMERTGTSGGLPVIRQKPGPRNALGKVKFLFPNSFNIYMHDTPQKEYFNRSERGLSHGCIRLSDAPKMAKFLLRNYTEWTPEKIEAAMNRGKEQFVNLREPVPVIITYYTAWVDGKGVLHFNDDIYQHDKQMAVKMFSNPQ